MGGSNVVVQSPGGKCQPPVRARQVRVAEPLRDEPERHDERLHLDAWRQHQAGFLRTLDQPTARRVAVAGADVEEDDRPVREVLDRHRPPRSALVGGHVDDLIAQQWTDLEPGGVDREGDQRGLELTAPHAIRRIGRVAADEAEDDARTLYLAEARELWRRLWPICQFLESTSYAAAVKAACAMVGLPTGPVRPPLLALAAAEHAQLTELLASAGIGSADPVVAGPIEVSRAER